MTSFTFETTPRIICAAGASAGLGAIAAAAGIRRALIVTDAGMLATGLLRRLMINNPREVTLAGARSLYAEAL